MVHLNNKYCENCRHTIYAYNQSTININVGITQMTKKKTSTTLRHTERYSLHDLRLEVHPPAGLAEVVLTGQRPELGRRVGAGADGALGGRLAGGGGGGGGGAARSRGATAGGGGRVWGGARFDLCLG